MHCISLFIFSFFYVWISNQYKYAAPIALNFREMPSWWLHFTSKQHCVYIFLYYNNTYMHVQIHMYNYQQCQQKHTTAFRQTNRKSLWVKKDTLEYQLTLLHFWIGPDSIPRQANIKALNISIPLSADDDDDNNNNNNRHTTRQQPRQALKC